MRRRSRWTVSVGDRGPHQQIGVTADELGRRVDHDVGAELKRLLEQRRRERVVDDESAPARRGAAQIAATSATSSSGFVGDSSQSMSASSAFSIQPGSATGRRSTRQP